MQNPKSTINAVIQAVEDSALCGGRPDRVAEGAGASIDEKFIVIPRSEFPVKQLDWVGNGDTIQFGAVRENTLDGSPEALRRTGLSYLAMADYLETKKSEAESELHARRFEIWKSFYPNSPLNVGKWKWSDCRGIEEAAINSIIELQDRLAEAEQNQ